MTITQVQEWPVAILTAAATGPATTAGNLLLARAVHRAGTNGLPATITDNAGNTWQMIGQAIGGGSGDVYMWCCPDADPITSATVTIDGDPAIGRTLFVTEWSGVAATNALLDATAQDNPSTLSPPPALVDVTVPGALVLGTLGATVSNRVFTLASDGWTPGVEHRAQQTTLIAAARISEPGTYGPSWQITSGAASTSGAITAAFRPADATEPDPDPPTPAVVRGDGTPMQAHLLTPAGLVPVRAHQEAD